MRRIDKPNYSIEYFDDIVYTAEANYIRITLTSPTITERKWVDLYTYERVEDDSPLARYVFADGVVEIDLSNWMRIHANDIRKMVVLYIDGDDKRVELSWSGSALYDTYALIHQTSQMARNLHLDELEMAREITPPSTIIVPRDGAYTADDRLIFPLTLSTDVFWTEGQYGGKAHQQADINEGYVEYDSWIIAQHRTRLSLSALAYSYDDGEEHIIRTRPMECGRRYALVRWLFPNGVKVQTFLEVRGVTDTTSESVSLATIDGTFNILKGIGQSFKLHLDELDGYDTWYYGTIATSSDVEVSLDYGETWKRVDVSTKKIEQPSGTDGKLGKIDIDVTLSKHSAI